MSSTTERTDNATTLEVTQGLAGPDAQPVTPGTGQRGRLSRQTIIVRALQLLLLIAWLAAWHVTADRQLLDPVLAKTPGESWTYFVGVTQSGELWLNTRATMLAVIIAWVLAGVIGAVAGLALGLMPMVERVISPFLDAANAMPRIALAPLFVVALGIGMSAKVALACTLVFFIVMSGARAGVRSADGEWLRLSAVLGATKLQLFWKIMLPVATPAIFAGLRLGLIYSLLGVVGSELIAARDGLGQMIAESSSLFQMEAVYAILILLAIIAVLLNQLMMILERWLLRWQPPADS